MEKYNPEPIGKTERGNVYFVEDINSVKTNFPGDVVIEDARSAPNPDVKIYNSALIRDEDDMLDILHMLDDYEQEHPSAWNRNEDIEGMLIEWKAHNDLYFVHHNYRCLHVDLDNEDKGTGYLEFIAIGVVEGFKEYLW